MVLAGEADCRIGARRWKDGSMQAANALAFVVQASFNMRERECRRGSGLAQLMQRFRAIRFAPVPCAPHGIQLAPTGAVMMSRLRLLPSLFPVLAVALAASLIAPRASQAADYPTRTVTVVVPFAAGGLTDVPARLFAAMLQEKIGQNVVVDNKTGGTGTIGVAYVSRAAPDGYTLLANSLSDAQNLHYFPVPYSPVDDFQQIGWIVDGPPLVLLVHGALPYKTLAEMIADAKANPSKLSFGTSGPASSPAMALAQLNAAVKTDIVSVPYRGSGEAARAVAGGQIQGVFTFFSQAKPLVDDGKVRALAVAAPKRLPDWPDVPTFKELGYNIDFRGFVGLAAPAKTPKPIVEYLHKQLIAVVESEMFKKRMAELGMAPPPAAENTPEKYDAYLRAETVRQGEVAKLTGQMAPAAAPAAAR
jgi:tripartite-type tricarboxylate transporter receptor subunit TctC